MDSDLVMECTDFVLEAENREFDLSPAEIKRRVEKISFKITIHNTVLKDEK